MAEPVAVSVRQFALQQGWNPSRAYDLKQAGRLVLIGDGKRPLVDVKRSLALIAASSDPQKGYMREVNARQREMAGKPTPPGVPAAPIEPLSTNAETPGGSQSRNATYNEARTSREVYQAKLAQIEYEQSIGRLVDIEAVRAEFAQQIVQVRDQFLRLPDRLAPMLVGMGDIDAIKRMITAEVRTALTQFGARNGST